MTNLHLERAVRPRGPGAAYDLSSPPGFGASPQLFATDTVPLRIVDARHAITTIMTVVTYVGDSTYEIRVDGAVIGFILRRDRAFTARAGPRAGQTRDFPQCLLWDEAARELLDAARL